MFDGIKRELGAFREDPGAYSYNSPIRSLGLTGAALVAFLAVFEGVHQGIAALTEGHQQITVSSVNPETLKASNLWGLKIGNGEEVETTTGEHFEDRPAWSLAKWRPIQLEAGNTYDITYYRVPFMEPNIRSATEIDEEK